MRLDVEMDALVYRGGREIPGDEQGTLQRGLQMSDSSFSPVLKETRESMVRHYLERTRLMSLEITFLLGFNESGSLLSHP